MNNEKKRDTKWVELRKMKYICKNNTAHINAVC